MSFDLAFFHKCDHKVMAEPLIFDRASRLAETLFPIVGSDVRTYQENITFKEVVTRGDDFLEDVLTKNTVHEVIEIYTLKRENDNPQVRKKVYKQSVDFILEDRNTIVWQDLGERPDNGEQYTIIYRYYQQLFSGWKVADNRHITITSINEDTRYTIDYITDSPFCMKCAGRQNMMYDMLINLRGQIEKISGLDKLKQDMLKGIWTIKGSNRLLEDYGTEINNSIGKSQNPEIFSSIVAQNIVEFFDFYKRMQQRQVNSGQEVTMSELFGSLLNIDVINGMELGREPTEYYIKIEFSTAEGTSEEIVLPTLTQDKGTILPSDMIEVSHIAIDHITDTRAVITWKTNLITETIVQYGETDAFGSQAISNPGLNHLLELEDLRPDTHYYMRILTANTKTGIISNSHVYTFKTLAA